MKKKFLLMALVVLIIVTLIGCTSIKEDLIDHFEYSNKDCGFGLNPPEGWNVTELPKYGSFVFMGPERPIAMTVVDLTAIDFVENLTLDNVVNQTIKIGVNNLSNFSIIFKGTRIVNGMKAFEIVYTFSGIEYEYKQKQIFIEKNSKIFSLTYSAFKSSYETYNNIVEESLNSFTIG